MLDIWKGSDDKVVKKQHLGHHGAAFDDLWGFHKFIEGHASVKNNFDISTKLSLGY